MGDEHPHDGGPCKPGGGQRRHKALHGTQLLSGAESRTRFVGPRKVLPRPSPPWCEYTSVLQSARPATLSQVVSGVHDSPRQKVVERVVEALVRGADAPAPSTVKDHFRGRSTLDSLAPMAPRYCAGIATAIPLVLPPPLQHAPMLTTYRQRTRSHNCMGRRSQPPRLSDADSPQFSNEPAR
ncbi:MAG: hypothetical protein JWO93_2933 [Micrococcaceae bacterium]|nr:hypothetical protein [Micrococcaceae bacterium]